MWSVDTGNLRTTQVADRSGRRCGLIGLEQAYAVRRPNPASNEQYSRSMLIVHVHVRVKPESIEPFKEATVENARKSIQERGIARFDVVQDRSDPAQFVLTEVYRYPEAPAEHKETAHYKKWRDAVADFMAEPRASKQYTNLFPPDESWT